jgi:hypothetical protein
VGGKKEKPGTNAVMKVSKLKEDYSKASAKVSELVRQLSFAGIAVIWILRTGEHAGGIKYSNHLLLPLVLFVASLAFDLLHYIYKTIVTGLLNLYFWRKYKDEEKDVPYSGKWNWPTNGFFWLKATLVVVAYYYLLSFIYVQLKSATPPVGH